MAIVRRLSYWLPVVVWMGVIFFFSTRERVSLAQEYVVNFIIFKSFHVIEYGVLFALNWRALRHHKHTSSNSFRVAFLVAVGYGAIDEVHQTFVPTRQGQVRDVIIDAIGALVTWYSLAYLLPKAPNKLKHLARILEII